MTMTKTTTTTITITIKIKIIMRLKKLISPQCKDCRCSDRVTHCRNQSSFHSCSVEEQLHNIVIHCVVQMYIIDTKNLCRKAPIIHSSIIIKNLALIGIWCRHNICHWQHYQLPPPYFFANKKWKKSLKKYVHCLGGFKSRLPTLDWLYNQGINAR